MKDALDTLIGESPAFKGALALLRQAAPTDVSLLILGETGTGKELVARAAHELSNRKNQPFVAINCAAFPETLLESELFGYTRGAFTGATSDRMGLFRTADKGTIFLDEVGEISLGLQPKLLRVLENKTFIPLGADRKVNVDARLIFASNRDIKKHAELGLFRWDLYYRIAAVEIQLPPLRDRQEDVVLLANHFIKHVSQSLGKKLKLTKESIQKLKGYDFPGNVRELENMIQRAGVIAQREEITPAEIDIPKSRLSSIFIDLKSVDFKREVENIKKLLLNDAIDKYENTEDAAKYLGLPVQEFKELVQEYLATGHHRQKSPDDDALFNSVASSMREIIKNGDYEKLAPAVEEALLRHLLKYNTKTTVAKMLKLSPMTLYRRVRDYHIVDRADQ